jgi:hypothetical protein
VIKDTANCAHMFCDQVEKVTSPSFVCGEDFVLNQLQIGNVHPLIVFLTFPEMWVKSKYFGSPKFSTRSGVGCNHPC